MTSVHSSHINLQRSPTVKCHSQATSIICFLFICLTSLTTLYWWTNPEITLTSRISVRSHLFFFGILVTGFALIWVVTLILFKEIWKSPEHLIQNLLVFNAKLLHIMHEIVLFLAFTLTLKLLVKCMGPKANYSCVYFVESHLFERSHLLFWRYLGIGHTYLIDTLIWEVRVVCCKSDIKIV